MNRTRDLLIQRQMHYLHQRRREKFRAPVQKFRLGPLVSGALKSGVEQKKGHSVRRYSNFDPK